MTGRVEAMYKKYIRGQRTVKDKTDIKTSECSRWGLSRKHLWKDCPACDAECRSCHKKGHFAKTCRSTGGVHAITEAQLESKDEEDFACLGEMYSGEEEEWTETLHINGEETVFKLDTGASARAIPSSNYSIQKHGTLQPPRKVLYGAGNHRLEVRGWFTGELCIEKKRTQQYIYVVEGLSKPLLGLPTIKALELIKRVHTIRTQ